MWEIIGSEIAKYLDQVESINKNDIHHHQDNPTGNATFRKDCTTAIGRSLPVNQFVEDSFIKIGTDIAYSDEVCAFVGSIPEVGKKQYKEFMIHSLSGAKKFDFDTITKNNFVTLAKSTDPKKTFTLK